MRKEGVFPDAEFVALAGHHVHRIVQHALDEKVAQLGHQGVRPGEMTERDRQRADVVMMTMSDSDGVQFLLLDEPVERQAFAALALRVRARVHEQAMTFDFNKPGAGADVRGGI